MHHENSFCCIKILREAWASIFFPYESQNCPKFMHFCELRTPKFMVDVELRSKFEPTMITVFQPNQSPLNEAHIVRLISLNEAHIVRL